MARTTNSKRKTIAVVSDEPTPESEVTSPPPPPTAVPSKKRTKKPTADDTSTEVSTAPSVGESTTVTETSVAAQNTTRRTKKKAKTGTRTPSSYVLFSMNERKTIMANSPDMTLGEVSKMCGVEWKKLSDVDRKPWVDKAIELKAAKANELKELHKNDPPRKKRTPSSYLLFAMEHRKMVVVDNPGMSIGDVSKICGSKWKTLSDAEKQQWKDKADGMKTEAS